MLSLQLEINVISCKMTLAWNLNLSSLNQATPITGKLLIHSPSMAQSVSPLPSLFMTKSLSLANKSNLKRKEAKLQLSLFFTKRKPEFFHIYFLINYCIFFNSIIVVVLLRVYIRQRRTNITAFYS